MNVGHIFEIMIFIVNYGYGKKSIGHVFESIWEVSVSNMCLTQTRHLLRLLWTMVHQTYKKMAEVLE